MLLNKGSSYPLKAYNEVTVNIKTPNESTASCCMFVLDSMGKTLEQNACTPNESLKLYLDDLPKRAHNVSLVIYSDQSLNLNSAELDVSVRNLPFCKYVLNEAITTETAFILGEFYKFGRGWRFRAVGQGYYGGLNSILNNFGSIKA